MKAIRVVLIWIGVGLALAAGLAAATHYVPPRYTADAFMAVRIPENILDSPADRAGRDMTVEVERRQQTMSALAVQPSILERVCEQPRVQATQWYRRDPLTAPDRLAADISVQPEPETSLILIQMTGYNGAELPEIVNPFCEVLRDLMKTQAKTDQAVDSTKLEVELKSIDTALSRVRKDMAGLRDESAPSLQRALELLTDQMRKIRNEQMEYEGHQARMQQELNDFTQREREGLPNESPAIQQALLQDPLLHAMQMKLIDLKVEGMIGANNDAKVKRLQELINERTRAARDLALKLHRSQLESNLEAIQNRLVALQSGLMRAQKRSEDLQRVLARAEQLSADERDLLERRKVIEGALTTIRLAKDFEPLQVYAQATEPSGPVHPAWVLYLSIGAGIGLVFGLVHVVLRRKAWSGPPPIPTARPE